MIETLTLLDHAVLTSLSVGALLALNMLIADCRRQRGRANRCQSQREERHGWLVVGDPYPNSQRKRGS